MYEYVITYLFLVITTALPMDNIFNMNVGVDLGVTHTTSPLSSDYQPSYRTWQHVEGICRKIETTSKFREFMSPAKIFFKKYDII